MHGDASSCGALRALVAVLCVVAAASGSIQGQLQEHDTWKVSLPPGSQPEGIASGLDRDLWVACLSGQIIHVDLTSNTSTIVHKEPNIHLSGVKFCKKQKLLFVAGTIAGKAYVYHVKRATAPAGHTYSVVKREVLDLGLPGKTYINDVAMSDDRVYFTDSFNPVLHWTPRFFNSTQKSVTMRLTPHVTRPVKKVHLGPFFNTRPGQFRANGIAVYKSRPHKDTLLVANTHTGNLYKVAVDKTGTAAAAQRPAGNAAMAATRSGTAQSAPLNDQTSLGVMSHMRLSRPTTMPVPQKGGHPVTAKLTQTGMSSSAADFKGIAGLLQQQGVPSHFLKYTQALSSGSAAAGVSQTGNTAESPSESPLEHPQAPDVISTTADKRGAAGLDGQLSSLKQLAKGVVKHVWGEPLSQAHAGPAHATSGTQPVSDDKSAAQARQSHSGSKLQDPGAASGASGQPSGSASAVSTTNSTSSSNGGVIGSNSSSSSFNSISRSAKDSGGSNFSIDAKGSARGDLQGNITANAVSNITTTNIDSSSNGSAQRNHFISSSNVSSTTIASGRSNVNISTTDGSNSSNVSRSSNAGSSSNIASSNSSVITSKNISSSPVNSSNLQSPQQLSQSATNGSAPAAASNVAAGAAKAGTSAGTGAVVTAAAAATAAAQDRKHFGRVLLQMGAAAGSAPFKWPTHVVKGLISRLGVTLWGKQQTAQVLELPLPAVAGRFTQRLLVDGIVVKNGTAYVADNYNNRVWGIQFDAGATTARLACGLHGPVMQVPTTLAFQLGRLWWVNAHLDTCFPFLPCPHHTFELHGVMPSQCSPWVE